MLRRTFLSLTAAATAAAQAQRDKARADYRRDIGICTSALVVCRETEAEAHAAYRSIIEHGDRVAADNLMKVLGIESQSFNERIDKGVLATLTSKEGSPLRGSCPTGSVVSPVRGCTAVVTWPGGARMAVLSSWAARTIR